MEWIARLHMVPVEESSCTNSANLVPRVSHLTA